MPGRPPGLLCGASAPRLAPSFDPQRRDTSRGQPAAPLSDHSTRWVMDPGLLEVHDEVSREPDTRLLALRVVFGEEKGQRILARLPLGEQHVYQVRQKPQATPVPKPQAMPVFKPKRPAKAKPVVELLSARDAAQAVVAGRPLCLDVP
jgi:hypothetical protein